MLHTLGASKCCWGCVHSMPSVQSSGVGYTGWGGAALLLCLLCRLLRLLCRAGPAPRGAACRLPWLWWQGGAPPLALKHWWGGVLLPEGGSLGGNPGQACPRGLHPEPLPFQGLTRGWLLAGGRPSQQVQGALPWGATLWGLPSGGNLAPAPGHYWLPRLWLALLLRLLLLTLLALLLHGVHSVQPLGGLPLRSCRCTCCTGFLPSRSARHACLQCGRRRRRLLLRLPLGRGL